MDIEKVLEFTDALVFAKAGVHLSDLQQAMLRESWSWQRQSYDQIADTYGYSPTYLKHDVGPKLWKLLSEVLGEKVNKTSFRAAIERRWQAHSSAQSSGKAEEHRPPDAHPASPVSIPAAAASSMPQIDWGEAPEVNFCYGRQQELAQLQQWILGAAEPEAPASRCRLVTLLGMGGMGKTLLSVKLVQQILERQEAFETVVWRSLRNAPLLEDLLTDLIQVFSRHQAIEYPETVAGKLAWVLTYWRSHRCLLVLDNVETILAIEPAAAAAPRSSGQYRQGYEGYGTLFRQIGETPHSSCLVLTSREKPRDIVLLEGQLLPIRSLVLAGLAPTEGQKLFQLKGDFQGAEDDWKRLVEGYSGNPLALKLIATTIQTVFDGSISDFLRQESFVFGTIRMLIEQQVERLSAAEKTVLDWLAIYREPATFADLRADCFPAIAPPLLIEALESLEQRSLIEKAKSTPTETTGKQSATFSLQPVVMEYVSERLVDQICQDIKLGAQRSLPARSPLKTHALLKANAKDYIREMQIRLILTPVIERLLIELEGERSLDDHLIELLTALRQKPELATGYAGGNLLNLLCQRQSSLRDYDLSQLTLWQADLRQVQLHDVNLAGSDLSHSVFTETIGIVFRVAFSPDGQFLATGDAEGGLRLWRVADGTLLLNFEGHKGWVWAVAFSADGQTLASCSSDKTIRLWNVTTGECLKTLQGHSGLIWSVAFSADQQTIASGGDEPTVRLWNVRTGDCISQLTGHSGRILAVAFSAEGDTLASASDDRTVRLWHMQTGDCWQTLEGHTDHVWSVALSHDGSLLASGSADRTIKLWDRRSGRCLRTLEEHSGRVRSVSFTADDRTLVSASDDQTIRIWEVSSGTCLQVLQGHTNSIFSVTVHPDGQTLASGSADQTVRLWNSASGRCLKTVKGYTNSIFSVAFRPDGQQLASGSTDQTVRLWDIERGECLRTLLGHSGWVTAVAFDPTGQMLASSSADQTVRLWDMNTGACLRTLRGHSSWVQSIAFSPTGDWLASGGDDQTIRLWSVRTGQCLQVLEGHAGWIWSVAFSPTGEWLASSSEDQTIRLWSMPSGACLHVLQGHSSRVQSIAFAPQANPKRSSCPILASSSNDQTIRLWSVADGQCLDILRGHENNVWSVAFSPDGSLLASGSLDQTIRLWNLEAGTCITTLPLLAHSVRSAIAFNPVRSGRLELASASHTGTLQIWDAATGDCRRILTPDKPYTGTNITNATGITAAQRAALKALGAIEH